MAVVEPQVIGVAVGGLPGPTGEGTPGPGVPTGGAVGQVLLKTGVGDFATAWGTVANSVAGKTGDVVLNKEDVGLPLVDNTADADKPVSAAQAAALATKADLNNPTFTGTVGGITKAMVGLGAVDNTSDAAKPISLAQQAALDTKAPINNPTFTGTVGGVTKAMVGLGAVDNTSDAAKPISTATAAALALRAPLNNPTFTGTVGGITKAMVGLGAVDNTADADKPVSAAQAAALATKAPLNNPTFTGTVGGINKAMVGLGAVDNTPDAQKPVSAPQQAALALKAPLDSPVFTGTVGGITKAMVGLSAVDNTSDAAKPVSTAQAAALATKAPINNPVFTGTVGGITKAMVGLGAVDNTADIDKPVSTATQAALDALAGSIPAQADLSLYAPKANPTFTGTVSGITKAMVGLGAVDNTSDAAKPVSLAQQAALDAKAPIANPTFTGTVGGITKAMVGLGAVDNTSDAAKPVSTATQAALNLRAPLDSPTFTGTVGGITKAMVGLGAVDNTSDAAKPVSTAQAAALALKAPLNNPVFTGMVSGITKVMVGLANVDNTADSQKPVSAPQQAALALRAPINNPVFTGTVGGITKDMVGLANVDNTADSAKPVSTAQAAALALKANVNNPTFTGTVGGITKAMVGLGNVDNTSDAAKPISTATQAALDTKMDVGAPLNLTKGDVGLANVDNTSDAAKPVSAAQAAALALKANLNSPTFTGTVGGITKAMVGLANVDNTSDAAKPVSTAQAAALALKAPLESPAFTGTVSGITKAMVGLGNVDNTADAAKPVSTAQQTALNLKLNVSARGAALGVAPLDGDGKVPAVHLPSGMGGTTETFLGTWNAASNTPLLQSGVVPASGSYYTVSVSGATIIDGNGPWAAGDKIISNGTTWDRVASGASAVQSVAGKTGAVTLVKADVGLALVDNTADANKPVSTAQQAALDAKAPINNPTFTGTVGGITKTMVGLANVDNTSDANKPVSSAQAAALASKAPLDSPVFTGTVGGITKAMVGLANVDNTSDANKPISTAQASALALKANLNSPTFTGTVGGITKAMVGLGSVDNTSDAAKPVSTAQATAINAKLSKAGDSMTGAFNEARVAVVSSPTGTDIWSGGNMIDLSGSAVITGFPAAPQAGASRTLVLAGNPQFVAGPNMLIEGIANGVTFQGSTYDEITVRALSTTLFKLTIKKYDGTAVVSPAGTGGEVTLSTQQTLSNKQMTNMAFTAQTLADAVAISWNANSGQVATVTLTAADRVIATPSNLRRGIYILHVLQDATGGRSYTFASEYVISGGLSKSTAPNARDTYLFVSDGVYLYGQLFAKTGAASPAPTPAPGPAPAPVTIQAEDPTNATRAGTLTIQSGEFAGAVGNYVGDFTGGAASALTFTFTNVVGGLYDIAIRYTDYSSQQNLVSINGGPNVETQFPVPVPPGTWTDKLISAQLPDGTNTVAIKGDHGYMYVDSVTLYYMGEGTPAEPPESVPGDTPATAMVEFGSRPDGEYPYGIKPSGTNSAKDTAVQTAYNAWKAARLMACPTFTAQYGIWAGQQITNAYYVDTNTLWIDQGAGVRALTVSEAIGYGMLIVVMMAGYDANAKIYFDGLYRLARGRPAYNMTYFPADPVGPTKYLMDWRLGMDTSHQGGGENACDGDEDIALALLMAHRQWGSAGAINYLDQAIKTINAMKVVNFAANGVMHVPLTGTDPNAVRSHDVSRTSDYMPQHFRAYKAATGDTFWDNARTNSLALTQKVITSHSPTAKMTPGWIWKPLSTTNWPDANAPQPSPGDKIESLIEGIYDQNAFRNPWRWGTEFVLNNDAGWGTLASDIVQTIKTDAGNSVNALTWAYNLNGTKYEAGAGYYDAQTAATTMVGGMCSASHQAWVDACWNRLTGAGGFNTNYFVGEPSLLCMLVASGNWWKP